MTNLLGSYVKFHAENVCKIIALYNDSKGAWKQACLSFNDNCSEKLTQQRINGWSPENYPGESFEIIPNIKDFLGKSFMWRFKSSLLSLDNKTNIILPDVTIIAGWFDPTIGERIYIFEISNYVEIAELSCDKQTAYVEIVK